MSRTALIFGISGQDGSYMTELLLTKGYSVVGTSRDAARAKSTLATFEICGQDIFEVDMTCGDEIVRAISEISPDEIYNFAAYSTGTGMYDDPVGIGELNGLCVARILEAIRMTGSKSRFCQASSAEVFRKATVSPQNERTPLAPSSPYGAAKAYAQWCIEIARQAHDIFACSAVLFNHESPRRSPQFLTRKVSRAAAEISLGLRDELTLGSVSAQRDWSHSNDMVHGMWQMLQADCADDYVLASGQVRSVADVCEVVFGRLGLNWRDHVKVDASTNPRGYEGIQLVGDSTRARQQLGWQPRYTFEQMLTEMVDADLSWLRRANELELQEK